MQVEVSVEVEEHVERLMRCTHVLRDGNRQQVSREVREHRHGARVVHN